MALSPQDRTLRLITIASWFPAMGLLIPYGVAARYYSLFPTLGLLPLSTSAVLGLAILHMANQGIEYRSYTLYADLLLALLLLAFTVVGFPLRKQELGTFAVMPLFVNICIHAFFVVRDMSLYSGLEALVKPRTCQYCHRDLQTMWAMKLENQNLPKADGFVPPPTQHIPEAQAPAAASASESASVPASTSRAASASPSTFTTPRQSMDYDAETLHSVDATIRPQSPFKGRHSCDIV